MAHMLDILRSRIQRVVNDLSTRTQMFKVVLSRVFDLRCNLEEIAGAGEPLLLFSKEEGDAGKGKGGSGPTAAAGGGETAAAGGGGSKGGK